MDAGAPRALPYESANPYWAFRRVLLADHADSGSVAERDVETASRERRARARRPSSPWLPLLATPLQLDAARDGRRPRRSSRGSASNGSRRRARRSSRRCCTTPTVVVIEDAHWMDEASTDILRQVERGVAAGPWLVCLTSNDDDTGFRASAADTRMLARPAAAKPTPPSSCGRRRRARPLHPARVARAGQSGRWQSSLPRRARTGSGAPPAGSAGFRTPSTRSSRPRSIGCRRRLVATYGAPRCWVTRSTATARSCGRRRRRATTGLDGLLVADGPGRLRFRYALVPRCRVRRSAVPDARPSCTNEWPRCSRRRPNAGGTGRAVVAALLPRRPTCGIVAVRPRCRRAGRGRLRQRRGGRAARAGTGVRATASTRSMRSSSRWWQKRWETCAIRSASTTGHARRIRAARRMRADDPVYDAQLCLKEAWIAERLGRYSQAIRWLRRGLRRLDELSEPGPGAATLRATFAWYGVVRQAQGRHHEAIDWCERAIALARAAGDLDALAHADFLLDWAHISMGRLDLATNSVEALRSTSNWASRGPGRVARTISASSRTTAAVGTKPLASSNEPRASAPDRRCRRGRAGERELRRDPARTRSLRRGRSSVTSTRGVCIEAVGYRGGLASDHRVPRSGRGRDRAHGSGARTARRSPGRLRKQ